MTVDSRFDVVYHVAVIHLLIFLSETESFDVRPFDSRSELDAFVYGWECAGEFAETFPADVCLVPFPIYDDECLRDEYEPVAAAAAFYEVRLAAIEWATRHPEIAVFGLNPDAATTTHANEIRALIAALRASAELETEAA